MRRIDGGFFIDQLDPYKITTYGEEYTCIYLIPGRIVMGYIYGQIELPIGSDEKREDYITLEDKSRHFRLVLKAFENDRRILIDEKDVVYVY